MPDLDLDPLAAAFAQFRAEAVVDIVSPGPAVAHRTVRRRRIRAAAAIIVAIAAVTALMSIGYRPGHAVTTPAAAPTGASPVVEANQAYLAIGGMIDRDDSSVLQGAGSQALTDLTGRPYVVPLDYAAGRHELLGLCFGTGVVQESLYRHAPTGSTVGKPIGWLTVPCNGQPVHTTIEVSRPKVDNLWLAITGDARARGHAGVAYMMADPFLAAAQLDALAQDELLDLSSIAVSPGYMDGYGGLDRTHRDSNFDGASTVGTFTMRFICGTVGTAQVRWTVGSATANANIPCDGAVHSLVLNATTAGPMVVQTTPSIEALGRSAYAYLVQ
jgi:hypothetical protein